LRKIEKRLKVEIPLYLELGFKPKNIVGVEGGDKIARAEFEINAASFGIDWRVGRLEKVICTEEPFDVVSLDFHGQACSLHNQILEKVPINQKALVLVNQMGKRERANAANILRILSTNGRQNAAAAKQKVDDVAQEFIEQGSLEDNMPTVLDMTRESVELAFNPKGDISDGREITIPNSLWRTGKDSRSNNAFSHYFSKWGKAIYLDSEEAEEEIMSNLFLSELARLLQQLSEVFNNPLVKLTHKIKPEILQKSGSLAFDALVGLCNITDARKLKYSSKLSKGSNTPFYSSFVSVDNLDASYTRASETVKFFLDCATPSIMYTATIGDNPNLSDFLSSPKGEFRFTWQKANVTQNITIFLLIDFRLMKLLV